MSATALEVYCDAFVAPGRHDLDSATVVLAAPGVRGVAHSRLLVSDDCGYEALVAETASLQPGVVLVFERASRCGDLLGDRPGWRAQATELAMVLRDLAALRDAALPDGLELRLVDRGASGAPGAVPLEEALAVAIASEPGLAASSADELAGYFGGLPASVQLLAAVDEGGVARATSACHVFGEYAQIFFVNTEPAWRRRGIGSALTLAALRVAAGSGARRAFLHATDDGARLYERLGFEPAGLLTRWSR